MFLPISWNQLLITTLIAVTIYYTVLIVKYRKHMISSYNKNSPESFGTIPTTQNIVSDANKVEKSSDQEAIDNETRHSLVHDLVDEIEAYTTALGANGTKESILEDLRMILIKYPTLNNTPIRESIEELISVSCESNCSVYFSASEIGELWQKAEKS